MILKLNTQTPIIKGYLRSCIYDLPRSNYDFLPIEIADKFLSFENSTLIEINQLLDQNTKLWFDLFVEKEYCFKLPLAFINNFPDINFIFQSPSLISNAIIDIYDLQERNDFTFLEELNCKHIVIRFIKIERLVMIVDFIQNHFSDLTFKSIDILFYDCEKLTKYEYKELRKKMPLIITSMQIYRDITTSYFIPTFIVNIKIFSEAQNKNVFYNQKIHIDINGNIKNGIETAVSFGNFHKVNHHKLEGIVLKSKLSSLWKVNKDKIDVCKDCEFRYMCIDNRVPKKRSKNQYFNEIECHYNPYISKWFGENHYKTLKEINIISDSSGFYIDHVAIQKINNEIWVDD